MENKGLNIFNDKYVLASPATATDGDYANIEAIIAHEYFHNWTGNRITCRDWFQLCLKEGLTVYRDQEFTADERSRPVKRIADVVRLRLTQFVEDAGPLAHNVRPRAYKEINNFYTATVYEKGAELIRLLRTLIGDAAFARGMERYFRTCDGTAATMEDFIACFAAESGRDLAHFAEWYEQAGTPALVAAGHYDAASRTYTLDLAQTTAPTPGQDKKKAMLVPVRMGLVGSNGDLPLKPSGDLVLQGDVLIFDRPSATVTFADLDEEPTPSLLRGFSAPVKLDIALDNAALLRLARVDSDPFNRWQALRMVLTRDLIAAARGETAGAQDDQIADVMARALTSEPEHAYAAQLIGMPTSADIARELGENVDPDAVHAAIRRMARALGSRLADAIMARRAALADDGPYSPDAASAGRRALRNTALSYLVLGAPVRGITEAAAQYDTAANMTDRIAALSALSLERTDAYAAALADFEARYRDDALVLDKWFGLQATVARRETLDRVRELMKHPAFSLRTPNRVYALLSSFAHANPTEFHRADGEGYGFVMDLVVALDGINPQVASRLMSAFRTWRTLEPVRRDKARAAIAQIAALPGLSRDVSDIAERALR
jgi:aminopeptidase N